MTRASVHSSLTSFALRLPPSPARTFSNNVSNLIWSAITSVGMTKSISAYSIARGLAFGQGWGEWVSTNWSMISSTCINVALEHVDQVFLLSLLDHHSGVLAPINLVVAFWPRHNCHLLRVVWHCCTSRQTFGYL